MKLYDGCYGVLNNGDVVGPMVDTKSGFDWPFAFNGSTWKESGVFVYLEGTQQSFRSVHPTRKEAEAAVRGEEMEPTRLAKAWDWIWGKNRVCFMCGDIGDNCPLFPFKVIGKLFAFIALLIVIMILFSCTSPTEPVKPSCKNEVWSDSTKAWVWNTTVCLNKNAYGQKMEK